MPQIFIVLVAIIAGIASFIFLLQVCTEQEKGIWALWLSVAVSIALCMTIWVNMDHNAPDSVYYTFTLERKEHTIFFTEGSKVKNATSIFGIDNIDPDKQVVVKHGPATCWSYGRYMDLYVNSNTFYTLQDKVKQ